MIELRWACWEKVGVQQLQYRQTLPTATGPVWTDWEIVPTVDATRTDFVPAKE